jgi:two-component system chemotaxis response regulator CheB
MSLRVLIVDECSASREALERGLSRDPDIEVLGSAADPYSALNKILALKPDAITLELSMPRMDGLTFLGQINGNLKIPVVICSKIALPNSQAAAAAINAGAKFVLEKPLDLNCIDQIIPELRDKLKLVALNNPHSVATSSPSVQPPEINTPSPAERTHHKLIPTQPTPFSKILLIGASTGGTQAIETIVKDMPVLCPPTVIVQHMPAGFTNSFAKRMDSLYAPFIKEAENQEEIVAGKILVAPGDFHLTIQKSGNKFICHLDKNPPFGGHRPAVDVMFNSAAPLLKEKAVGVILTGMGCDGSKGLLALRQNGAYTIAQNQESCIVFGMPRAAIECKAAIDILHLNQIASASLLACQGRRLSI